MSTFLFLFSFLVMAQRGNTSDTRLADKTPVKILAKVGTEVVTTEDFAKMYRPQGVDSSKIDSLKHSVLDKLIADKLMLVDARTKGFKEKITSEITDFQNRLMVGELYKQAISKRVKISPLAVRSYWWKTGTTIKAEHILVKDKNLAWKVYRELRQGGTFNDLAPKYSEDQATAQQGGMLPDIKWGTRDPALEKILFSLKPGIISFPIKTAQGYEIIKVKERLKKRMPDFKTESERIKRQLMGKKERELADGYLEHLGRIAHIKFYKHSLNEIVKPDLTENTRKMTLVKWVGGKFSVGEILEQANMGMMGRTFPDTSAVKSWVNNRLTYQYLLPAEASRHGFYRLPDIKTQVTTRENTMLIQQYKQAEIDEKSKPTEEEIKEYWITHKEEYGKDFELIKARVAWDLEREKRTEIEKKVIETLRQTMPVEISEETLITI